MGRQPSCDKLGLKKGPWTPEEDVILVSYIQEHGPGNWKFVPTNAGLSRCSKSCRLRWTNYLRPGIKRGNFTENEEKMIIQLQELLGNRWAAIASYLPQRTDNDIKNHWNTHLKKKVQKLPADEESKPNNEASNSLSKSKGQWERRLQTDIHLARQALSNALSPAQTSSISETKPDGCNSDTKSLKASAYASSIENISTLLEDWMKQSPNLGKTSSAAMQCSIIAGNNDSMECSDAFEHVFSLEFLEYSKCSFSQSMSPEDTLGIVESKPDLSVQEPLSFLAKWLLDECASDTNDTRCD